MLRRDVNLLYGAPEYYLPPQLERKVKKLPVIVRVLSGLVVLETLFLIIFLINLVNPFQINFQLPTFSFPSLAFLTDKAKGDILGVATNSAVSSTPTQELTQTPTSTPTPTMIPTPTPAVEFVNYTVKSGDNWWTIVRKVCNTKDNLPALIEKNREKNDDPSLHTGDTVKIYCSLP